MPNNQSTGKLITRQEQFLNYLEQVKLHTSSVQLADNGLAVLMQQIEQAELIVPVVGGFSAGKSTLINSFLGRDLLPTAITPETALATELRYSTTDYIEAISADNQIKRYEISQLSEIKDNAQNFKFIRLFLNNQNLAEIQPLVLVDMPGFDAPIENHRNAILEYLNRGTYFVFLTSVEDGTITRTMHQEIKTLRLFGKGFTFCLSKTNLRSPSDVKTVQQTVQNELRNQYHFNQEVVLLDDNGGANLKQILTAIQPDALFKSLFIEALQDNYFSNEESIRLIISTLKASKEEGEEAIKALKQGINKLQAQKEKAIADVEGRYSSQGVNRIAENVASALRNQQDYFISLVLNNATDFQRQLGDTVQSHLLAEVQSHFQEVSSDIISGFRLELQNNFNSLPQTFQLDDSFITRIAENSAKLLLSVQSGLKTLADKAKQVEENSRAKNIYRTIASIIGITTTIVSPVVEVALLFLPEIINFLTGNSKEERERRQQQERRSTVERKFLMEIIPQISGKIRQELPPLFKQNTALVIEQVAEQFEEQLAQKRNEVEQAMAEKVAKTEEINQRIQKLESVKQSLSALAKPVIFA
ncbi:dynamin family protein [Aggregatibacter actinomycetemcomitans]|uniref:dynamin family protein n=1 Tax=Aggregatibacter actinomycetemcomitans TaxID=714 RepID=UPI00197C464C|nr:dynamin family protein [Aggregatibacter actinomycetemcomitans]MBN6063955.1 dynamin family protein [Aggregatibacter actinomycetemcomitans]MBN6083856.1 dynamin family protein [Aggregatibacter actinomycetemcomitans]